MGYLDSIVPNDAAIADFCSEHNVVGFHVFELCESDSEITASCRNFAPLVGISEESATGSSTGALACYFAEHLPLDYHYVVEQGRAMGCASMLTASVEIKNSKIISVKVGGSASRIGTTHVFAGIQLTLPFAVIDNKTGDIIGSTRLCEITTENECVEISYTWYAKRNHKKDKDGFYRDTAIPPHFICLVISINSSKW